MSAESGTPSMAEQVVTALVPMVHVADVERSVDFYRLLGFEVGNRQPRAGRMHWAWLYDPRAANWKRGANVMLSRSECAIDGGAQEVLFYLYATDLKSLHAMLVGKGVTASDISYPLYLPAGEFRIQDPDGYTLMLAQAGPDTP